MKDERWRKENDSNQFFVRIFFLNERIVFSLFDLFLYFKLKILTIKIKEKLIFLMRSFPGK